MKCVTSLITDKWKSRIFYFLQSQQTLNFGGISGIEWSGFCNFYFLYSNYSSTNNNDRLIYNIYSRHTFALFLLYFHQFLVFYLYSISYKFYDKSNSFIAVEIQNFIDFRTTICPIFLLHNRIESYIGDWSANRTRVMFTCWVVAPDRSLSVSLTEFSQRTCEFVAAGSSWRLTPLLAV